jgi:hypothetical protein
MWVLIMRVPRFWVVTDHDAGVMTLGGRGRASMSRNGSIISYQIGCFDSGLQRE